MVRSETFSHAIVKPLQHKMELEELPLRDIVETFASLRALSPV
jgi:hypothetical protein